jgi:ankyrin repeat protein
MYALAGVASGGSTKVVEALLAAGARVDGEQGGDSLIAAARANHVEVLRLLADAGADLNFKERSGDTPLGVAVEAGAREAVGFLEERGAREW